MKCLLITLGKIKRSKELHVYGTAFLRNVAQLIRICDEKLYNEHTLIEINRNNTKK
jgi:hypothetical protein